MSDITNSKSSMVIFYLEKLTRREQHLIYSREKDLSKCSFGFLFFFMRHILVWLSDSSVVPPMRSCLPKIHVFRLLSYQDVCCVAQIDPLSYLGRQRLSENLLLQS